MYSDRPYHRWLLLAALLLTGCPRPQEGLIAVDPMAGVVRYDYSGIRIAQQINERPFIQIRICLGGGPALRNAGQPGLERLAIAGALEAGAGELSGAAFQARIEALGASVRYWTRGDHSVIVLDCLPEKVNETWQVFSQALLRPGFGEQEFRQVQLQTVAALEAEAGRPGRVVEEMARAAALGETWEAGPGAAERVKGYSAAEARDYFRNELMQKCRLAVLTSGRLGGEDLADLLLDNLDLLPEGDCGEAGLSPAVPKAAALRAVAEANEGGQAVLQHVAGILVHAAATPERTALVHSLAWMVQSRLAERLGAAGLDCRVDVRAMPVAGSPLELVLSSPRALACTELVLSELRAIRSEGLGEEEWRVLRREALTRALQRRESAGGALTQLSECLLYGHWEDCGNEVKLLQSLDVRAMNAILRSELTGISLAYQGDTTRMDRKALGNF